MSIEAGKNFSLRAGEFAQTGDKALRVGFDGVAGDSRCPKGAQCVWAGDALLRVWLQQGERPKVSRELHTASGAAQMASAFDHQLRVLRLDPYPVDGKAIASRDYVATLVLSRGAAVGIDR